VGGEKLAVMFTSLSTFHFPLSTLITVAGQRRTLTSKRQHRLRHTVELNGTPTLPRVALEGLGIHSQKYSVVKVTQVYQKIIDLGISNLSPFGGIFS